MPFDSVNLKELAPLNSESIIMKTLRINKLYGGTMDEHCCDSFKTALDLGLIERISCEIAEYALKNERVFMFIKGCPFCFKKLEEK